MFDFTDRHWHQDNLEVNENYGSMIETYLPLTFNYSTIIFFKICKNICDIKD